MEVFYSRQFYKDLKKIKNKKLNKRIKDKVEEIEKVVSAHEPENDEDLPTIPNLIKLQGYDNHYRVRVGDMRLGITIEVELEESLSYLSFLPFTTTNYITSTSFNYTF